MTVNRFFIILILIFCSIFHVREAVYPISCMRKELVSHVIPGQIIRTPTPSFNKIKIGNNPVKIKIPTQTPTPIEMVMDYHIFDPQWIRLETCCARSPVTPYEFFSQSRSSWTSGMVIKSLKKKMYREVGHTRAKPFLTSGSFYDMITGKSVGRVISKGKIITSGIETRKGYNLVWDGGRVYIWSNKELNNFHTNYDRWPYTSIGGLALIVPYIEPRNIRPQDSVKRTSYGIRADGTVILMQYIGSVRGLHKTMIAFGAIVAVQVDSGSQGLCCINGYFAYYNGGLIKNIIMGIPSFYLYRPQSNIRG